MKNRLAYCLIICSLLFVLVNVTAQSSAAVGGGDSVISLTLINADTDLPISGFNPIANGAILDLAALPTSNLNIRANTSPTVVGSVRFALDGNANYRTESVAPYALEGDSAGDYNAWTPTLGSHSLTATPFSEASGGGVTGTALTIGFTVVNNSMPPSGPTPTFRILVFSKTVGFRHPSIADGITAITELAGENGFAVDFSEDSADFTTANLAQYAAVVFLSTTGDFLNAAQQTAFEQYIQSGKGFVGIHAATDGEYSWAWYDGLLGTHFNNHPAIQQATLTTVDNGHISSAHLPTSFDRTDEWYNFQSQPVDANVLVTINETSYSGGNMGDPHPISWYKEYDGGRSWYTAMGHTPSTFSEQDFRQHLLGGILWAANDNGVVSGELKKWHPVTVDFYGPGEQETSNSRNPFTDYRLQVLFTGPSGQQYDVPGFFAGNGSDDDIGVVWRARFSPDQAGTWTYSATFREGNGVAINLSATAGVAASFNGVSGTFSVTGLDTNAQGFLSQGRLQYVGEHYLKFADGNYWIKGGTDSPENFLGYNGFDSTIDQGGPYASSLHDYAAHVQHWQAGDPNFTSSSTGQDAKGIIGALNYLSSQYVNSIYFLPMNLGGDGQETYPMIGADGGSYSNIHYDISKLNQWSVVLDHAQRKGIKLNIVLAETELANEQWFDSGALGFERKVFLRELIARYGHLLAIKWNLSEENDFPVATLEAMADYIQTLDWANHPITVHTKPNNSNDYMQIKGDGRFSATSIQYNQDRAGEHVERWRTESADSGRPWVIDMDENNPANTGLTPENHNDLRKRILYDTYFSGGNIEWYSGYDASSGGDLLMEDFSLLSGMWQSMWYARSFMQDNLPFWEMEPADGLLAGENAAYGGGEVFAKVGEVYAVYLPNASAVSAEITLDNGAASYLKRWYNPRSGQFVGSATAVSGGTSTIGSPPSTASEDWVLLYTAQTTTTALQLSQNDTRTATPLWTGLLLTVIISLATIFWRYNQPYRLSNLSSEFEQSEIRESNKQP